MRTLTAPDRLALLLPWLNGESLTNTDTRQQLRSFLRSFDEATADTGYLRVIGMAAADGLSLDATALERLRDELRFVLRSGFPLDRSIGPERTERTWEVRQRPVPYRLFLGTVRRREETPSAEPHKNPSSGAKRQHAMPGAYEMHVSGAVSELIPYLVMHLLTAPKAASVGRCPAPAPNNWDERCQQFLIRSGQGHPREFCSEACRVRSHAERLRKAQEAEAARRRSQKRKRRA